MKKLLLVLVLMLFAMQIAMAAVEDFEVDESEVKSLDGMGDVTSMIGRVIGIVQYVAAGFAVLFAAVTGFQFMGARDPQEKKELGDRLKYILIGLAIVLLSFPIVSILMPA